MYDQGKIEAVGRRDPPVTVVVHAAEHLATELPVKIGPGAHAPVGGIVQPALAGVRVGRCRAGPPPYGGKHWQPAPLPGQGSCGPRYRMCLLGMRSHLPGLPSPGEDPRGQPPASPPGQYHDAARQTRGAAREPSAASPVTATASATAPITGPRHRLRR